MSAPSRDARIETRRWAINEARQAIADISALPKDRPFSFKHAVDQCNRLIAACAVAMSVDTKGSRSKRDLMLGHYLFDAHVHNSKKRAHSRLLATFVADIFLSYVRHAHTTLRLRNTPSVYAMVRFVVESFVARYLAASPWTNWDVLHDLCVTLRDCVGRHESPQAIEAFSQAFNARQPERILTWVPRWSPMKRQDSIYRFG